MEVPEEIPVLCRGESSESINFFEEKSVTGFAGHTFGHIQINVRKAVFPERVTHLDLCKQLRREKLVSECVVLVTVNDFAFGNAP